MKTNSNYRYMTEANSDNNSDNYLNITGFVDSDMAGFDSEMLAADASPAATTRIAAPTSKPYIVSVANAATANVSSVLVLGAAQNLPADVTNYGNPASITISMGIGTITYGMFLFQTLNQPFTAATVYLQSSTSNQVLTTYTLQHIDSTGRLCQDPVIPLYDPYQNQSSMTIQNNLFTVDGMAMLTFATLYASATLNIYIFPSNKINTRNALLGANVESQYSGPKIVQGQTLNVSSAALQALKG